MENQAEYCLLQIIRTFVPLKQSIKNKERNEKGIHRELSFGGVQGHVQRPRVLCRSAVSTKETIEVNGETYPVYKMEISNTSHPFTPVR